jgi:hypothetical protein
MSVTRAAPSWAISARDLYLVAMAVFVVNIVLGILNGADALELNRDQILTHVHAGTVGWLTLAILGGITVVFQGIDRRLLVTLVVLVPLYVLAFYTGNFQFRAVTGTLLLIAIGWLVVWLWGQYLGGERSLPRLALTLAITSFAYGAVVGVLLQIQFALELAIVPGDSVGAHAAAMTFGYLVLAAFGFLEWGFLKTRDLPRAGLVQILSLFIGGIVISVGLLAGAAQAAGGIYLLTQVIAVVLFVVRIWPRSLRVPWLAATPARHFGAASIWVVAALILFMYIVATVIQDPTNPDALPVNILIASDHAVYIGVVTNGALGVLSMLVLTRAQRSSWIGHLIFWGVNLGLLVFVIGLIVDTAELKRIGAPVMGVVLLLALAILAYRAVSGPVDTAEEDLGSGPAAEPPTTPTHEPAPVV